MKVITLAKTKELLGISDTSHDAAISGKIPFIDSKVKQICNNRFNDKFSGSVKSGSVYVTIEEISGLYIEVGQLIEGEGIPAECYVEEVYYDCDSVEFSGKTYNTPVIKLSSDATATNVSAQLFLGIPVGYQDIIASGIQYLINRTSTNLPSNSIASKSILGVSKSFASSDQEIDNKYGMPAWFVKALPKYQGGH